jgi:hypothetical protein
VLPHRPILDLQPWHLRKVARVPRNEDALVRQSDSGDTKVMSPDADLLLAKASEQLMRRRVKAEDGKIPEELQGSLHAVVGGDEGRAIGSPPDGLQAAAKLFLDGHYGGDDASEGKRQNALMDHSMATLGQRNVVGVEDEERHDLRLVGHLGIDFAPVRRHVLDELVEEGVVLEHAKDVG